MSEDWAAIARAIDQRSRELGLRQRDVAKRAQVSQATVRELQRHTVVRRRSTRTLEALSLALEWHPQHLLSVLEGRTPPHVDDPVFPADDVPTRLDAIERHLREITRQLDELNERLRDDRDGERSG